MKLSLLIPSVNTRRNTFLPKSLEMLYSQYERLPEELQKEVEILYLIDNKKSMLGKKRTDMVNLAQGEYISHIDCDDRISDDYIKQLLEGIETGSDVITFKSEVTINGENPRPCYYTANISKDYNTTDAYYRIPNHICCVKRSLAEQVPFPFLSKGEDAAYAKLLKKLIRSEYHIDKTLYHYDFNSDTTETQHILKNTHIKVRKGEPIVDVVILSNAKTPQLQKLTEDTIKSCIYGANGLPVNVIVMEQNLDVRSYENTLTLFPSGDFNYNEFANFGIKHGDAEWVMVANNDLLFHNGWLHCLLGADHPVVSPKCPIDPRQKLIDVNMTGSQVGRYFSGWAFMMKRELWEEIEGLDESVSFWCSDNAVVEQVKEKGIKPMLVPSALVTHLGSSTLKTVDGESKEKLTKEQVKIFNKKYNQNLFNLGTY